MSAVQKSALEEAQKAFGEKLRFLLDRDELSHADLEKALTARKAKVAEKTISNIKRAEHPSQIDNFSAIADYFGIPLWIMFIPKLPFELLDKSKCDRLERLIATYVSLDDEERKALEIVATKFRK